MRTNAGILFTTGNFTCEEIKTYILRLSVEY